MDISYIDENIVRLKGKQVTLLTNFLEGKIKTTSDGVLLCGSLHSQRFFKEEVGVIFQGAGEYEIKGTKITGFKTDEEVMYSVAIDGLSILIGNVATALKMKDKLHEHDVAMLFTNDTLSQGVLGIINASVIVFSGEKSQENAKAFDKTFTPANKYVITKDKLPAETEFVFLA